MKESMPVIAMSASHPSSSTGWYRIRNSDENGGTTRIIKYSNIFINWYHQQVFLCRTNTSFI